MTGINWQGHSYPAMEVVLFPDTSKEEVVFVSITLLEDRLMECIRSCSDGCAEAIELDEKIFYYLSAEEFNRSDEEIRKILEDAIS